MLAGIFADGGALGNYSSSTVDSTALYVTDVAHVAQCDH